MLAPPSRPAGFCQDKKQGVPIGALFTFVDPKTHHFELLRAQHRFDLFCNSQEEAERFGSTRRSQGKP
jgi:hypothetical protein